jgi:hypothetical protein
MHNIRVEERRILGYDPDMLSEVVERDGVDVLVVDEDATRGGVVEPVEKTEDGGFAAPRGADYGDFGAGGDGEGEVFEDGAVGVVPECDIVEANGAAFEGERFGVGFVLRRDISALSRVGVNGGVTSQTYGNRLMLVLKLKQNFHV